MSDKEEKVEEPTKKITKKITPQRQSPFARAPRKVSFDVWAKTRGVKDHHKGGMKAFIKNPDVPRILEEWDRLLKNY